MVDNYWNLEIGKVEIMIVNCEGNVDGINTTNAKGNEL